MSRKLIISALICTSTFWMSESFSVVQAARIGKKEESITADDSEWSLDIIHEDTPSRAITDVGQSIAQSSEKEKYATIEDRDTPPADQPAKLERVDDPDAETEPTTETPAAEETEVKPKPKKKAPPAKKEEDEKNKVKPDVPAIEYKKTKTPEQL